MRFRKESRNCSLKVADTLLKQGNKDSRDSIKHRWTGLAVVASVVVDRVGLVGWSYFGDLNEAVD